jgi:hypothetical protein
MQAPVVEKFATKLGEKTLNTEENPFATAAKTLQQQ